MNILEILTAAQGGGVVTNLAKSFGLDNEKSLAVLEQVVPELSRAMERNTFNRGGVADLIATLGQSNFEAVLKPGTPLKSDAVQQAGVEVLDNALWTKDRSRGVAARAARETGLDQGLIKEMLPAIAALVMGGLSSKAGGALDGILKQIGGLPQSSLPVPGETAPAPRTAPASGGDVGTQRPLPIPGEIPGLGRNNNPYGDLSDIIRRGGIELPRGGGSTRSPGGGGSGDVQLPQGGGALDTIIREVLGGILGFQSKSAWGWLIRLIVVRWGWGFIQSILRRLLTGR